MGQRILSLRMPTGYCNGSARQICREVCRQFFRANQQNAGIVDQYVELAITFDGRRRHICAALAIIRNIAGERNCPRRLPGELLLPRR